MGGKASKSTSTSTTGSAQPWATPAAQAAVGQVQSVVNQNQPGLQGLTDLTRNQVVDPLLSKFNSSLGTAGQANGYNSDVLSGKYMGGNPYLGAMMDQTNRNTINNVNSQFELSGRYGSDAHGYGLARGIADSDNALQYQNYTDEMNRMGQAATNAARDNTVDISSLLSAIGAGAQIPYTGVSNLSSSLGALFSGGTETSKSTGAKPGLLDYLAQAAGNAAAAYSGGGG